MTLLPHRLKKKLSQSPSHTKQKTKILLASGQYHPHDQAKWDSYKTSIESEGIPALMYLLSLPFNRRGNPEVRSLVKHSKSGVEPRLDVRFCLITLFAFLHCRLYCLDVRGKGRDTLEKIPSNRDLLWLSKGQKKQRSLMLGIQLTPQKLPNSALSSGSKKTLHLPAWLKKYISKIKKSLSRNDLISPICSNT